MRNNSFFKIVFLVLAGLTGVLMLGLLLFIANGKSIDPDFPPYMGVFFTAGMLLIAGILGAIGVFTYKDASKHGMDPWMWTTIVVFVPNLLGLIIYLIARNSGNNNKNICSSCKKPVSSEFKLCPYCGSQLCINCPECSRQVSAEWNLCPYCSARLK